MYTCLDGVAKAIEQKGFSKSDIKGIGEYEELYCMPCSAVTHLVSARLPGITNQRETATVWSKKTGKPLCNAIAWPDTRNTSTVRKLASQSDKGLDALKAKTG